jgi:hypothetical protein
MALAFELIPANSKLTSDGDGAAFDLAASATRTFLCSMQIAAQIEQESVEISVWGSANGEKWGPKPLLIMPQRFYKGETEMVLDVSQQPDLQFIRAAWKLFRWGRVSPHPMFVLGFTANEIPAFPKLPSA